MAAECVAMGMLGYPFLFSLNGSLSGEQLSLLVTGGFIYFLGAVFYASKKPRLWPTRFGYHELFHLCTLIAAAFHFAAIYRLIV
jgi:hemolysin III